MSLYYIQDIRKYVGNSMLWYRKGGHGYGCDIREAGVFTYDEAKAICHRDVYRAWPKDYIDARVSAHIDMQQCGLDMSEFWSPPVAKRKSKGNRRNCYYCGQFFYTHVPDGDSCDACARAQQLADY